jgi:uncharacterized membrane protein
VEWEKEENMARKKIVRTVQVGLLLAVFAAGYLCGSLTQRDADAQLKELGQSALQKASDSGGILGTAAQLGTSISEMQQHVDGLQKNIETLKKVKAALGG